MPVISGGGGGGGPAAGTYVPAALATGLVANSDRYVNPISGSGFVTILGTADGGDAPLIALGELGVGDVFPDVLINSSGADFLYVGDQSAVDPYTGGAFLGADTSLTPYGWQASPIDLIAAATKATQVPRVNQVSPKFTITSGALPTVDFTGQSGTGLQVSTSRDADIYVETGTAGSVVAALSPDNTTYTTIYTRTVAITDVCHARVPAGWYLKLTATTAVLGVGAYV